MNHYVKRCAMLAAAREEGLALSPVEDVSKPFSSYNLLVRQFRTAIGMQVAEENAMLKIERSQYIRPTRTSATYAASEQKVIILMAL